MTAVFGLRIDLETALVTEGFLRVKTRVKIGWKSSTGLKRMRMWPYFFNVKVQYFFLFWLKVRKGSKTDKDDDGKEEAMDYFYRKFHVHINFIIISLKNSIVSWGINQGFCMFCLYYQDQISVSTPSSRHNWLHTKHIKGCPQIILNLLSFLHIYCIKARKLSH